MLLGRGGGGGKWQKEKRISVIATDAGRHSRIRFYLSDISATDLLILVIGEGDPRHPGSSTRYLI